MYFFGILTILDHFMHLITNLDHFSYPNASLFINSSNNDKSGSFYLQNWIIFTSFILVGRWIRGRAQRNHVLTHVVFVPKVFSLAGRIHLLLTPGCFLGTKTEILSWAQKTEILSWAQNHLGPFLSWSHFLVGPIS